MARLAAPPMGDRGRRALLSTTLTSEKPQQPGSAMTSRSLTPSTPEVSFSSDKENHSVDDTRTKAKGKSMSAEQHHNTDSRQTPVQRKRKLGDADVPVSSQAVHRQKLEDVGDRAFYDPEQSMDERRAVRKDYRELARDLTNSRALYAASTSNGLLETIEKSNKLFDSVRQTSDATLDSRLLVSAADLSVKRTTQLNLGNTTAGIDLDDFVTKCIVFMRSGPATAASGGRTGNGRTRPQDSDEEDSGDRGYDEGDAFNWEYLGRQACCPHNMRPPVPGFLLGPLSVQKRARQATQRRERLQKRDPRDAIRPEELKAQDLEQVENSNLSTICKNIRSLLAKRSDEGEKLVREEYTEEMTEGEVKALMRKHGVADDGGVPLFNFAFNPQSFGQTVENLFYLSFLIRDGAVGIGNDSDLLPTLFPTKPRDAKEIYAKGIRKHQAIFHLDFDTWSEVIDIFEIQACIIPHRPPDPGVLAQGAGWYA